MLFAGGALRCNRGTADVDRALVTGLQRRLGLVARLTGSGDLPPCAERMKRPAVACAHRDALTADEREEVVRALDRAAEDRSPEPASLRRQALATLLRKSDARALERAVTQLMLALEMEPSSPGRQNDLAAVLLLRGAFANRPADWAYALDLADRAAAGGLPEARLNRALALELLTLSSQAKGDWAALGEESRYGARRLRFAETAAARQPATDSDRRTPNAVAIKRRAERLLGAWASATLDGRADAAAAALDEAARTAAEHAAAAGDRLLLATVDAIRAAKVSSRARLDHVARGHAAFEAARGDELYARCGPQLDLAERELSAGATPFVGWAYVDQAICAYYRRDLGAAIRHLDSAFAIAPRGSRFPTLSGRAHWIRGLIRTLEGAFSAAERELSQAAAELGSAAEPEHATYLQTLRAKALENGGRPLEAWQSRMAALRGRAHLAPQRTLSMLEEAVQSLRARQLARAASWFVAEQIAVAQASLANSNAEADFLAFALLQRAALGREQGAVTRARESVTRAERVIGGLPPDAETRRRLELELAVERALLPGAPAGAAREALGQAIVFFHGDSPQSDQLEALRLFRLRAKALRDDGDFAAAEADLRRALDELERQRRGLQANDRRARFDAQMRATREDLLALLLDRGRTGDALELAETISNRWWLESAPPQARQSARQVTAAIPPGTLVLRYAFLGSRAVIWMLDSNGVQAIHVPVSERRLRLAARMCREYELPSRRADRPFCDWIAAQLLPGRVASLPPGSRLVIVADQVSQEVPFAALRLRPGTPYLVERLRLALIPGALHVRDKDAASTPPGRAVFVADPAFDRVRYPALQPLVGAQQATAAYAGAYSHALVLRGSAATPEAVLSGVREADLIHFEAHGWAVEEAPDESGVVLAAGPRAGPTGAILTAADIARNSLPGLRLAVLAACRTSPLPYEDSAQLAGLATALIAAGATEVVTASSDIDNATAIRFFTAFHRCYSERGTGEECLRASQLAFLRSADPVLSAPRAWAPYQVHVATWNR